MQRAGSLGPVTYQVYLNGVPYNNHPPILDAQLIQVFGKHDQFTFRIEYPPTFSAATLTPWPDQVPVSVLWGQAPDLQWWYGYVNNNTVSTNADSGSRLLQITYTCIGTSSVLNSVITTSWQQVTPTYIAKAIAAANGFRSVTNPSSWLLGFEQQAESDFQFLNRIANKTGMRFWCSGGTLYMITPTTALKGGGQSAVPAFYANKARTYQDTCRNFVSMQGSNLPGSIQANRVLYGIDTATGTPFAAATAPNNATSRVSLKSSAPTTNYADAKSRTDAWSTLSQFWVGADATLYGFTGIYPGKLVRLAGTALPASGPGHWLVTSATHNLAAAGTTTATMDRYLVDVVLLKNDDAANVTLSNITPITPEFIPCSLNLSGTWIATNRMAVTA